MEIGSETGIMGLWSVGEFVGGIDFPLKTGFTQRSTESNHGVPK